MKTVVLKPLSENGRGCGWRSRRSASRGGGEVLGRAGGAGRGARPVACRWPGRPMSGAPDGRGRGA
eukprot:scaffold36468_cov70-Phaeocystis_antarctica.AAC.2